MEATAPYLSCASLAICKDCSIISAQYILNQRYSGFLENFNLRGFGAEDAVEVEGVGVVLHRDFDIVVRCLHTGKSAHVDFLLICGSHTGNDLDLGRLRALRCHLQNTFLGKIKQMRITPLLYSLDA